jgi:hypothetical protein
MRPVIGRRVATVNDPELGIVPTFPEPVWIHKQLGTCHTPS